jgi:UDPglucose 6-dehydrogenase
MRVAIVGTGYVGLVSGACLADLGHTVVCIDTDEQKIQRLRQGVMPIFEPGLEEVVKRNADSGRLSFTTSFAEGLKDVEVISIAVGTPSSADGSVDMRFVESAAQMIGKHLTGYAVVADKSTVPVGTSERVAAIIQGETAVEFDVVSNPEFLREGHAVFDFLNPSRVVIGSSSRRATDVMVHLYAYLDCPKVVMDPKSAELAKYASNAFLATKISFINEMSHVCEAVGADVDHVARAMGLDPRIGKDFLRAGLGWGGSCFPKDVLALQKLGEALKRPTPIVNAAIEMNRLARRRVTERLAQELGDLRGKRIAVLGLAFKGNTDDTRESASVEIIRQLIAEGAEVRVYDPVAKVNSAMHGFDVPQLDSAYAAAEGASALVIATEWEEFRALDLKKLQEGMAQALLFDARNLLDPGLAQNAGFRYLRVGRQT